MVIRALKERQKRCLRLGWLIHVPGSLCSSPPGVRSSLHYFKPGKWESFIATAMHCPVLSLCLPSEKPEAEHTDHGTRQDQPHRIQFETQQKRKGEQDYRPGQHIRQGVLTKLDENAGHER